MTTNEVATSIEAWIVEILPELDGSTYEYHASRKSKPFPDAAVEVDSVKTGATPTLVGMDDVIVQGGWEQVMFRSWTVRVMLMTDEDPPAEAEETLHRYSDAVHNGILLDRTLGGRVMWTSTTVSSDFTPPFIEYEDGARGRVVTTEFVVGEAVGMDD